MKHQALKAAFQQTDTAALTHEDIDLTITALEIYATALRDEIEEQADAAPADAENDYEVPDPKGAFNYEKKLGDVQLLLQKYRQILQSLLTA